MNRQEPQSGQRYWQNGGLCQIVTLAADFKTKEKLVIYQALYGSYEIYACPLAQFLDGIDASDTFAAADTARRRLKEEPPKPEPAVSADQETEIIADNPSETVPPMLMEFLDADSEAARYKILSQMADCVDDHMIDTMAVVLDIVIDEGPLERRYQELKNCIRTRMRYETNRLR